MIYSEDNLYLTYSRTLIVFYILHGFVIRIGQYFYPIASCDRCHASGRRRLLNLESLVVLLAGPVSHTSTEYMDFVGISNISLIYLLFILLILVGVELPLCMIVTLF